MASFIDTRIWLAFHSPMHWVGSFLPSSAVPPLDAAGLVRMESRSRSGIFTIESDC